MATVFDRIDQLRRLLGLNQSEFTQRVHRSRGSWNNWRDGQDPDGTVMREIAERWQVSLDSLWAREGTAGLEPSPALRVAQDRLTLYVVMYAPEAKSPGERVILCHNLLRGGGHQAGSPMVPGLTEDAWAEWLHWDQSDWLAATVVPDRITETQIAGAAFLCGWYHGQRNWAAWFSTGHPGELAGNAQRILGFLADKLARGGLDLVEVRRRINEMITQ